MMIRIVRSRGYLCPLAWTLSLLLDAQPAQAQLPPEMQLPPGAEVLTPFQRAQRDRERAKPFLDLLAVYRSGQIDRAIADVRPFLAPQNVDVHGDPPELLLEWLHRTEQLILEARKKKDESKDAELTRQLETFLLLSTEVLLHDWPTTSLKTQKLNATWTYLDFVYDTLMRLGDKSQLLRAWYLLWDSFRQAHITYTWEGWPQYSKQALEMFPDDAEILLSAGARSELQWWTGFNERRDLGKIKNPLAPVADLVLEDARELLRRSLRLNPKESETRLRLAHVLLELDERDEAMKLLSGHPWPSDEAAFEYLACLFEGDLQAKRGDVAAALKLYDRAIALVPVSQSARLAKAQLLYAQGRRPDAVALSTEVLTDDKPQLDPWWLFITGRAWRMPAYLKLARSMVM